MHHSPVRSFPPSTATRRLRLQVQGAVQGVGFRPWCLTQARALGLQGWVRNDVQGLHCELQGPPAALADFQQRLRDTPPPLARIDHILTHDLPVQEGVEPGESGFRILASQAPSVADHQRLPVLRTGLPADVAPCEACLDELFSAGNRRYRHPFINCTQCGPRFTITARLPYDRPHTSLAGFALCPACAREYADPADRRHHAQPIACPDCGPRLALWSPRGEPLCQGDAAVLAEATRRLRAGQVLAVKGVGGYHLICDALQPAPLTRLRQGKQRASKPFAVLAPNPASARQWVQLDDVNEALLAAPARSILLLPCQPGVSTHHPLIAPGLDEWGLMLPATPLHWLLLHELAGRPADPGWRHQVQPQLLVMTSANPGGEPLVTDEIQALAQLAGLADALLVHDRAILGRVDDSVRRPMAVAAPVGEAPSRRAAPFVRRARGHVPDPIRLPGVAADAPAVLATGGWLKNTVCVTRGNEAFLSAHVGDLGSAACREALAASVERLCDFLQVQPRCVAHDLHPDDFSSRHAQALAQAWQVPALPVQHHHAHAAAVLAEHGVSGPALALVLDGTGLGTDGGLWGGELLQVQGAQMSRRGHLPELALPGGDRAAREPWRMAAAVLAATGQEVQIARRYAEQPGAGMLAGLMARGLNCPATSSTGRLFDAAASLLGLLHHSHHEAHAAQRLEAAADACCPVGASGVDPDRGLQPWPGSWSVGPDGVLRWPGLWLRLTETPCGTPGQQARAAAEFHVTLAAALAEWVRHHAHQSGLSQVVLGGGCFINRWLRNSLLARLKAAGLQVLEAQQVPPGDGGLSLGQAAVALASLTPQGTLPCV